MKRIVFLILAVILLAVLVFYSGREELFAAVSLLSPAVILPLFLLQLVTLAAGAWILTELVEQRRRALLLSGQSIAEQHIEGNSPDIPSLERQPRILCRLSWWRVFQISMAGSFVESITPSVKFGGEAAKVYLISSFSGLKAKELVSMLIMHKTITFLPFLVSCGFFLALALFQISLPLSIYVLFGVLILLSGGFGSWYFLFYKNRARFVNRSRLPLILAVSTIIWLIYPVKIWIAAWSLGLSVDLMQSAVATYSAYLAGLVPLFPGGLGSFEAVMALVFSLGSLSAAEGLSIALVSRTITFWFPLVISTIFAFFLLKNPSSGLLWKTGLKKAS